MIETRVLDSSSGHGKILLQLEFHKMDVTLRPHELVADIRASLSEKIAAILFEKIEPKIIEALKGEQNGN